MDVNSIEKELAVKRLHILLKDLKKRKKARIFIREQISDKITERVPDIRTLTDYFNLSVAVHMLVDDVLFTLMITEHDELYFDPLPIDAKAVRLQFAKFFKKEGTHVPSIST